MKDGFLKAAALSPALRVADCTYNTAQIIQQLREAAGRGVKLAVFPEFCLTGYTCGDLFLQETLLEGALKALETVRRESEEIAAVIVVGLPLRVKGKLYNVAAVVNAGDVLAFVPKTYIPNYSEFYEQRHFVSADTLSGMENVLIKAADGEPCWVPLVTDTIFQCDEQPLFTFGVEICEDLWVPNPPSTTLAQMGAHIIVNLSASDEIIGKAGYRRDLVRQQSGRLLCAYLYADAGFGESTQDLVFAGHDLIAENGAMLAESRMFEQGIIYADIDLQRLAHERQRMNTFEAVEGGVFSFSLAPAENDLADRTFPRTPFVPANKALRDERCEEILTLQATGLATRLRHTHAKTAVVGLSGGLDSTLALIVLVHAFDMLSLDRKGILSLLLDDRREHTPEQELFLTYVKGLSGVQRIVDGYLGKSQSALVKNLRSNPDSFARTIMQTIYSDARRNGIDHLPSLARELIEPELRRHEAARPKPSPEPKSEE